MRVFVEKCHHEKEDNYLFPLLARKGVPVAGCPFGVLSHEHETSRKLTRSALTKAVTDPDLAAAQRAFDAMLQMKKIDIAAIEVAYRG